MLDHRLGADATEEVAAQEMDSRNRESPIAAPRQIQAWTRFTFPGRHGKYSDFQWD